MTKWLSALFLVCLFSAAAAFVHQGYKKFMFNSYMEKGREQIKYFDESVEKRGSGSEERFTAFTKALNAWLEFKSAKMYLDQSDADAVEQINNEIDNAVQKIAAYAVDEKEKAIIAQYPFLVERIADDKQLANQ